MPTTNFILKHWKKQQTVFLQNLEGLRKQDKEKTIDLIHDLRVATKKLRAYLKLFTILLNSKDYMALFERTELLFDVLGKHRDIEMGLATVSSFEKGNKISYADLTCHLKGVHQQAWAWVLTALGDYDEKDLLTLTARIEQDLEVKSNDELIQKLKGIIEKGLSNARRLANHLGQQPHLIRKLFKDIYYWASLLPKEVIVQVQLKEIKRSLDYLGGWQDLEMLQRKIKHFRKDFVPGSKEVHRLLKELEEKINDKQDKLLDRGGESIHSALSQ